MYKNWVKVVYIFFLLISLSGNLVNAQPMQTAKNDSAKAQSKDVVDVLQKALKLRLRSDSTIQSGNGPYFSIMPVVGYSMQSGLTGALVTNTSFYTDKNRTRFSNLLANAYYSQFHQYWIIANSNVFLEKQKLHFLGDTRFYKFPTQTYGLGTNTTLDDILHIDFLYLRLYQSVFREIRKNLFAGIGYNLDYHWKIEPEQIQGNASTDFNEFQKGNRSTSSGITLNLLYDSRKNAVNPEGGTLGNIQYRSNMKMLGSDSNWQSLIIEARHYIKPSAASRNLLALWTYSNLTVNGTPPYLDLPSIGWDNYSNTGRGYIPGRFTGRNLIYVESEYRFEITRNGLLGGVVFGNAETVLPSLSSQVKKVMPGTGLGLRIKMNKYSNTNIAIDYGFGIGGSHGLFFNLGEVF